MEIVQNLLCDKHLWSPQDRSIAVEKAGLNSRKPEFRYRKGKGLQVRAPPRFPTRDKMRTRTPFSATSFLLGLVGIGVLGLAGVVGSRQFNDVSSRIAELEGRVAREPQERRSLEEELETVRADLASVRDELNRAQATEAVARSLATRLAGAETRLVDIAGTIDAHDSSLEQLAGTATLEEIMAKQAKDMTELWQALRARVDAAEELVSESRERLDDVDESLSKEDRDVIRMWNELVGPTVQLAGEDSVGSGVILRSVDVGESEDGEPIFDTHILTAWHVIRDIVEGDLEMPVPVAIYQPDGSIINETATLLGHDAGIDVAVLRLDRDEPVEYGASLATRARLKQARIFERIYAVGCPLGNDPIPTSGEIATRTHLVDDVNYWMINAPTYIGNSGGGIFDADTHALLGIFSKIYTHGALRPTIVPHMGLVTPLETIYDWLQESGFERIVPVEAPAVAEAAPTDG